MIDYDLKRIRLVVMDVDGVLSRQTVPMNSDGVPMRTADIKDGYVLQLAVKLGLELAIISGGTLESVRLRYEGLGVKNIYLKAGKKLAVYEQLLEKLGLRNEEVAYIGDDIPDYQVMSRCGLPCCPGDAAIEIKQVARYISPFKGGEGCVRDVIEQILRAQGRWALDDTAFGW